MKEVSTQSGKDIHGHHTLEKLSKANHFNNWIYQSIRPWVTGKVFEIGSGIGNITSLIVNDGFQVMVTETDETYLDILKQKFKGDQSVLHILPLDLVDDDFDNKFHHLFQSFDTVIAINVIEHIEDDHTAFQNAQKFLKQGGRLIVLVPNSGFLYNGLDKNLSHFKRYSKKKINNILNQIGLIQEDFFYFNTIGVAGWWFSGSVLRNKTIPSPMVSIFEFLIPYTSWMDKLFRNRFGLSIIVIGKKIS